MALEVFAEREIEPGRYLAIIGNDKSRDPSYVIGLEYAVSDEVRVVKLLPADFPRILSVQEAINLYRSIHSEDEFEEECERVRKLH